MSETLRILSTGESAPDVLGVIEGWRTWRFNPSMGLRSIFGQDYWKPGKELVAWCPASLFLQVRIHEEYPVVPMKHSAPHRHCRCGIYAAAPGKWWGIPEGPIYGKVKLWGVIVPGSKANRGQYAYPSELYAPDNLLDDPTLKAYGVPIKPFSELPWQLRLHRKLGTHTKWFVFVGAWGATSGLFSLLTLAAGGIVPPYISSIAILALVIIVILLKG